MPDDDIDRARREGEKEGRIATLVDDLARRVARLETGVLALIGSIVAAWAKAKGLW